jgi:hypothetical protein
VRQEGGSAQHSAADAAHKKKLRELEEKMFETLLFCFSLPDAWAQATSETAVARDGQPFPEHQSSARRVLEKNCELRSGKGSTKGASGRTRRNYSRSLHPFVDKQAR